MSDTASEPCASFGYPQGLSGGHEADKFQYQFLGILMITTPLFPRFLFASPASVSALWDAEALVV
jgi:hypothetical protein